MGLPITIAMPTPGLSLLGANVGILSAGPEPQAGITPFDFENPPEPAVLGDGPQTTSQYSAGDPRQGDLGDLTPLPWGFSTSASGFEPHFWRIDKDATDLAPALVQGALAGDAAVVAQLTAEAEGLIDIVPAIVREGVLKPLIATVRGPRQSSPPMAEVGIITERLRFMRGLRQHPAIRQWERLTDGSSVPDPNVLGAHLRYLQRQVSYVMPGAIEPAMVGATKPEDIVAIVLGEVPAQIVRTPTGVFFRLTHPGAIALIQSDLGLGAGNGYPAGENTVVSNGLIALRHRDVVRTTAGAFEIFLRQDAPRIEPALGTDAVMKGVIALDGAEEILAGFGVSARGDLIQITTRDLADAALPAGRWLPGAHIEVVRGSLDSEARFSIRTGENEPDQPLAAGAVISLSGRWFRFDVRRGFAELVPVYHRDRGLQTENVRDLPQQGPQETDAAFSGRLTQVLLAGRSVNEMVAQVVFAEAMAGSRPHQMAMDAWAQACRASASPSRLLPTRQFLPLEPTVLKGIPAPLHPGGHYWGARLREWLEWGRESFAESSLCTARGTQIVADAYRYDTRPVHDLVSRWGARLQGALGLGDEVLVPVRPELAGLVLQGEWDFLFRDSVTLGKGPLPQALALLPSSDPEHAVVATLRMINILAPDVTPEIFAAALLASQRAEPVLIAAHTLPFSGERPDLSPRQRAFLDHLAQMVEIPGLTAYLEWLSGVMAGAGGKRSVFQDIQVNHGLKSLTPYFPFIWSRLFSQARPTGVTVMHLLRSAGETTHPDVRRHLIGAAHAVAGFQGDLAGEGQGPPGQGPPGQSEEGEDAEVLGASARTQEETGLTPAGLFSQYIAVKPTTPDGWEQMDLLATLILSRSEAALRAAFSAAQLVGLFTALRGWAKAHCWQAFLPITSEEQRFYGAISHGTPVLGTFLHPQTPEWLRLATGRLRHAALAALDALPGIEWELYGLVDPEGPYAVFYHLRDKVQQQRSLLFDDSYSNSPERVNEALPPPGMWLNLEFNPALLRLVIPARAQAAARFRHPDMIARGLNSGDPVVLAALTADALSGLDIAELAAVRAMVFGEGTESHSRPDSVFASTSADAERLRHALESRAYAAADALKAFPHLAAIRALEALGLISAGQRIAMARSGVLTPATAARDEHELIACLADPAVFLNLNDIKVATSARDVHWGTIVHHTGGYRSGGYDYPRGTDQRRAESTFATHWTPADTQEIAAGLEAQIVPVLQAAQTVYRDSPRRKDLLHAILKWDLFVAASWYPLPRSAGDWWQPSLTTIKAVCGFLVDLIEDANLEPALRELALQHLMNLAGETRHGLELVHASGRPQAPMAAGTVNDVVDAAAILIANLLSSDPLRYVESLHQAYDASGFLLLTAAAALTGQGEGSRAVGLLASYHRDQPQPWNVRLAADPEMAAALSSLFYAGQAGPG